MFGLYILFYSLVPSSLASIIPFPFANKGRDISALLCLRIVKNFDTRSLCRNRSHSSRDCRSRDLLYPSSEHEGGRSTITSILTHSPFVSSSFEEFHQDPRLLLRVYLHLQCGTETIGTSTTSMPLLLSQFFVTIFYFSISDPSLIFSLHSFFILSPSFALYSLSSICCRTSAYFLMKRQSPRSNRSPTLLHFDTPFVSQLVHTPRLSTPE